MGRAGAAVGALFMVGLTSAIDAKHANDKLANQLGLTEAEAKRAGEVAGDVFSQGFGESMDDVNAAINGVASNLGGMSKVSDDELKEMSSQVLALSQTFDQDLGQTSRAIGQLMKTGMASDATEALDIIAAGLRKGADQGGDFLDTLVGGADNLKSFGFTGEQATGLIIQGLNAGAESAESVTGLFEELVGNVSAGGEELEQTFTDLGLNGKQMTKDLTSGGPEANKALDQLLDSIRKLEDPIKQDAMMAALFGEEGAAMQNTLLAIDPSEATKALGEFGGVAKDVTANAAESQTLEASWRQIATTVGELLAPALKTVAQFMAEHPGLMKILVPLVLGLAVALGIFAIATWAVNAAMLANPITWVILGIVALIAVVALIIIKWDEIKESTKLVWGYIVDKLGEAWDWMIRKATELWLWLSGIFSDGWNWIVRNVWNPVRDFFTKKIPGWVSDGIGWIQDKWNDMIGWFAGIPGRLASGARGMWDFISNGLKGALNGAIGLVNDGIWFINSKLIGSANMIPGVNIPYIPYIPYLAEGGVVTAPTLAMIGEGGEPEAVTPLSTLDGMLRSVAQPVQQVGREPAVLVIRGDGSPAADFIIESLRVNTRNRAGGSIVRLIEEG
jgi:TP901 family phage tail tape measure protein